ncbi:TolC family protein [Solitalea koreensis]|nr:TolC family protein [Solitalea koreensis]
MCIIKKIISITIITLLPFWGLAQQKVMTLDSILTRIKQNSPQLLQYDARIKAVEESAKGAKAWMAPMAGVGTFMTPYPGQMAEQPGDQGQFMISLEQDIPNPIKLNARASYMKSKAGIEAQNKNVSYNELRSQAKKLYYEWLVLDKKIAVLQQNKDILQTMKKLAEIRFTYNQGLLSSIYKTEARIGEVEDMLVETNSKIQENKYWMKGLMNVPYDFDFTIDTTCQVKYDMTVLPDTAYLGSARSDIQRMNETIQSMKLNQTVIKSEAKPDFKIKFDHMIGYNPHMPLMYTLMGMVSIPMAPWSSKMYKSGVRQMDYEIEAMKKEREAMLNQMSGMSFSMKHGLHTMEHHLTNYETHILPALKKSFETLMISYQENKLDLPLVIDGWEALNMAQMKYLEQKQQYYQMIADYEKQLEK